jgi:hypothetical protein
VHTAIHKLLTCCILFHVTLCQHHRPLGCDTLSLTDTYQTMYHHKQEDCSLNVHLDANQLATNQITTSSLNRA